MNQQSNPEEIDIIQFFALFGRMFSNFFRGIKKLFIKTFYVFVEALLYIRKNIIYLGLGLILGLAASFFVKNNNNYYTQAMVRTNYDAQLSLQEKMGVINDLIQKDSIDKLAQFLNIQPSQADHLTGVKVTPVMDDVLLLDDYENYLKTKDTVVYKFLEFKDYKESFKNNPQLNNYWMIRFNADNPTAFKNFNSIFKNIFKDEKAINNRRENYVNALKITRQKLLQSIKDIDSLRNLYNSILIENAKKENVSSTNIILNPGEQTGPEATYNLFNERLNMLNHLLKINKKINKYDDAFVMLNSFQDYGIKEKSILRNNHIKYALFGFLLALFILLGKDFNKFMTKYEKQKISS